MKQPAQEYQKYASLLTTVFSKSDKPESEPPVKVKAIRIRNTDGTYNLRLHVENNGQLEPPLEFSMDKLRTKILEIKNYSVPFNGIEIAAIIDGINNTFLKISPIPTLDAFNGIGWHYIDSDQVDYWKSATGIDLQGTPLPKDIFAPYPAYNGDSDENITAINNYISRHGAVAQSILLYGFSAVLAGYFHKTLLLSLSGKSSRGKTTISKLIISLFAEPENDKLCTNFNVTLNKLSERLDGIIGAAVIIDDLSLADYSLRKQIRKMIYDLDTGKEKERMKTKTYTRDPAKWATTIIFSAEEPLLSLCNPEEEGAVGRLMELNISANDLFSNAKEANEITELSHKHYGLLADRFVIELIKSDTLNKLKVLYEQESYRVKKDYSGVLARVAENVAIVTLCGTLLNKLLAIQFNIEDVENYLMSTAKDNLDNFRMSQKRNVVMQEIYPELIEYARQECPNENKGLTDHVVLSSKALKAKLTQIQKEWGYKPIDVKRSLKEGGVLNATDGPYSYVGTINGKSFRGLYLYIKDVKEQTDNE